MAKNNSEEINFQHYVDGVKRKKLPWNFFIDLIQDLSYSDISRLRKLNAILLMELTMNFSDIDKMKYLNGILLIQFKNYIETKHDDEMTKNDYLAENLQESNDDQILNEENFEEITEELSTNKDIQMTENKYFENSEKSNSDQILIQETFEETMEEISTNEDIQMPIENELEEDISSFCKKEIIEFESNSIETTPQCYMT